MGNKVKSKNNIVKARNNRQQNKPIVKVECSKCIFHR